MSASSVDLVGSFLIVLFIIILSILSLMLATLIVLVLLSFKALIIESLISFPLSANNSPVLLSIMSSTMTYFE